MKTADDVRKLFFDYFTKRGHVVVPPSSLVPEDPSVLFTTAGMQQFKPYYTGERDPKKDIHASLGKPLGAAQAVSIQPCVRTSDIDDVGDASHLTFFEMCGNFAFSGAYFKREAIEYAWEFLTDVAAIPQDELWVTVFSGDEEVAKDEEAKAVWLDVGLAEDRIHEGGRKENFWGPTGKEGPCGPTTEIHYDVRGKACSRGAACVPNCPCGRFLELWNLVFNEYFCSEDQKLTPLVAKGVDTGMGLERLLQVLFGMPDVFSTPFFAEALVWMVASSGKVSEAARERLGPSGHRRLPEVLSRVARDDEECVRSLRIIADHLRASIFLLHEGIQPSNTDRGYILRRFIRRTTLHARRLALPDNWPDELTDCFVSVYEKAYPRLGRGRTAVLAGLHDEIARFAEMLPRGMRAFEKLAHDRKMTATPLSGADLYRLFETYGFPIELGREMAAQAGLGVDDSDLETVKEAHRERSRKGSTAKFGGHGLVLDTGELKAASAEEVKKVTRLHTATHMLQAALRQVLGPEVEQRGSDITAQRLRFDFSFPRKVTAEELQRVERLVNDKVRENLAVERQEMPFEVAKESGALAFARGAYPEIVSVYSIPGFSREVCGGPHVTRTGEVGRFRILKEQASAAGIRRIRAVVEP